MVREIIGRVVVGVVVKKLFKMKVGIEVLVYVLRVYGVEVFEGFIDYDSLILE